MAHPATEYDHFPQTAVDAEVWQGFAAIARKLKQQRRKTWVIVIELYPGYEEEAVHGLLRELKPDATFSSYAAFIDPQQMDERLKTQLTDDRIFGRMYYGGYEDFLDEEKLEQLRQAIGQAEGLSVVFGPGASLVVEGDVLVYGNLARWNIECAYGRGLQNFNSALREQDSARKIKRGYFVDWRIADRRKYEIFSRIDYMIDANGEPWKMIAMADYRRALDAVVAGPFRLKPYFAPGVWGGQWLKRTCGLPENGSNYAWAFDGVPEENSVLIDAGETVLEFPALDVVRERPRQLLGERTFARFGAEFPIRFDMLDTMDGQNLSLQVHPTTQFIHEHYGMAYTQDESYYLLDTGPDAAVYLGLRESADPEEMVSALRRSQQTGERFDAESYVNRFPVQPHDHLLIPAGTVHGSGKNCLVLEISATPYNFTFKLYDWGRVDLDGRPRPIHIDEGEQVIDPSRTTRWVQENLIDHFEPLEDDSGAAEAVRTGLYRSEFIETVRYRFSRPIALDTHGEVRMGCLVAGKAVVLESPDGAFAPRTIHYAETFIVPAQTGRFTIRPRDPEEAMVLLAAVRF